MKSIADFTRELCICPNSNLGALAVYEVEPISLLLRMDTYSLAHALFWASNIVGDSLRMHACDRDYFTNFAFIFLNGKRAYAEGEDNRDEIVSKKGIIDKINSGGFVSLHDSFATHRKSFVDCLVNRNMDMGKFYRMVRKSIPLLGAKLSSKSHLNVMSSTTEDKIKFLLSNKNIVSLGLMHRFVFITQRYEHSYYENKENISKFINFIKEGLNDGKFFSFNINKCDKHKINILESSVHEELMRCVFVEEHVKSLTNLYRMLLIKIDLFIQMLRKNSTRKVVNVHWDIADLLARMLLNEKIHVLTMYSKSERLFYDLQDFIIKHEIIFHRKIIRKFQYADKKMLMRFIEYFIKSGLLRKGLISIKPNGGRFPLHYSVKINKLI